MAYKTQSPDTDARIEKLQFDRLRAMKASERYARGLALVDEGLSALWKSLERLHPTWSRAELLVEWTRIHYGDDLAARYAEHLECHSKTSSSASR
jgi:hypothetical protein